MPKLIDLTGQRFGSRVAINLGSKIKGRTQWNFSCNCGYNGTCLTQSLKPSKGCKHCVYKKERPTRRLRPFEAQYNAFVNKARYPIFITYKQFVQLTINDRCH